uniref:Uncharacterized protein n=1 Tax=Opuntia streptacantha TaxID=393608 RepID=A0A7C9API4_OPUST
MSEYHKVTKLWPLEDCLFNYCLAFFLIIIIQKQSRSDLHESPLSSSKGSPFIICFVRFLKFHMVKLFFFVISTNLPPSPFFPPNPRKTSNITNLFIQTIIFCQ